MGEGLTASLHPSLYRLVGLLMFGFVALAVLTVIGEDGPAVRRKFHWESCYVVCYAYWKFWPNYWIDAPRIG